MFAFKAKRVCFSGSSFKYNKLVESKPDSGDAGKLLHFSVSVLQ